MDVSLLAHKNLDNLHGYVNLEYADPELLSDFLLNFQLLNEDEKVIGFYINQSIDRDLIIVTDQQIIIRDSDRFTSIEYNNIQSVHTKYDKGINKIFVCQKNGLSNLVLVAGIREDKFLDLYGFLRFIKKVLVNINLNNTITLAIQKISH
jgi:Bacterial PH domain